MSPEKVLAIPESAFPFAQAQHVDGQYLVSWLCPSGLRHRILREVKDENDMSRAIQTISRAMEDEP